ncbi:MAG: hypothetical protein Aurels2KO_56390 [Aureliella sp.]
MSYFRFIFVYAVCIVAVCGGQALADDNEPSLAIGNVVFSEDEALLAEAENAMINYANARDELMAQSACYVRGEGWSFSDTSGMQRVEHIFIGARNENAGAIKSDSPHFYYAHGVRMVQSTGGKQDYSGQLGFTIWDQFVRQNTDSFYRRGAGSKLDRIKQFKTDSEDKLPIGKLPNANVDFFIVPVSDYHQIRSGSIKKSYLGYFLRGDVLRAARDGKQLKAIWRFRTPTGKPTGISIVTFDERQGGMPVRVEWPYRLPGEDPEKTINRMKISSMLETEWREQDTPDGSRFLPVKIRGVFTTESKVGVNEEAAWLLKWSFGKEALAAIPSAPLDSGAPWQEQALDALKQDHRIPHLEYAEAFQEQMK